jgi:hypothetical protein
MTLKIRHITAFFGVVLLSSVALAGGDEDESSNLPPNKRWRAPYRTPETMEQPPRKLCAEADHFFGVWPEELAEVAEPPIKRWAQGEEDVVEARPANTNRQRPREEAEESEDEVINHVPSKSRAPAQEAPHTNRHVADLMARVESGDLEAAFKLAELYLEGRQELDVDTDRGLALLVIAAENGYLRAQEYLGRIHEFGLHGLQIDDAQALEWYQRAVRNGRGLKKARQGLERVRQRQTPPVIPTPVLALAPAPTATIPQLVLSVVRHSQKSTVLIITKRAPTQHGSANQ